MLDSLIQWIIGIIDKVIPFWMIKQWEAGIRLRGGTYIKTLSPGFYLKIPFLDEIFTQSVVTTTLSTPSQSLTTKDKKQVVVKGVIKYNIADVTPFLLKVSDSKDALSDTTQAIIKEQIIQRDWQECNDNEIDNIIAKKLRVEVKKWGIEIEKFTMTDIGLIPSVRIFNEVEPVKND